MRSKIWLFESAQKKLINYSGIKFKMKKKIVDHFLHVLETWGSLFPSIHESWKTNFLHLFFYSLLLLPLSLQLKYYEESFSEDECGEDSDGKKYSFPSSYHPSFSLSLSLLSCKDESGGDSDGKKYFSPSSYDPFLSLSLWGNAPMYSYDREPCVLRYRLVRI